MVDVNTKLRHEAALKTYENWIMSECGLEPLDSHGKSSIQINRELDTASSDYLKELLFNAASVVTIVSLQQSKTIDYFCFKGKALHVRSVDSEKLEVVECRQQQVYDWEDIYRLLTKSQSSEYKAHGASVLGALGIGDGPIDLDKIFAKASSGT